MTILMIIQIELGFIAIACFYWASRGYTHIIWRRPKGGALTTWGTTNLKTHIANYWTTR